MDRNNATGSVKCWVELYADSMYTWALHKTGSKEVAEDLVQDTFLVAVQSFQKFEEKSNPKTWLFAILNNKISDHYRTKLRAGSVFLPETITDPFDDEGRWKSDEKPHTWPEEGTHLLDDGDFLRVLDLCMKGLPDTWYSVLQLKYLDENSGEQICQELGISPTNFWQLLHRAKLKLRKCLEENWFKT